MNRARISAVHPAGQSLDGCPASPATLTGHSTEPSAGTARRPPCRGQAALLRGAPKQLRQPAHSVESAGADGGVSGQVPPGAVRRVGAGEAAGDEADGGGIGGGGGGGARRPPRGEEWVGSWEALGSGRGYAECIVPLASWLYRKYWRVEAEGVGNVPGS